MSRYGYTDPKPQRSIWAVLGIVLAVLLGIGGLVFVGLIVLIAVAMSHYGSNK
jgi:hypothetical protein